MSNQLDQQPGARVRRAQTSTSQFSDSSFDSSLVIGGSPMGSSLVSDAPSSPTSSALIRGAVICRAVSGDSNLSDLNTTKSEGVAAMTQLHNSSQDGYS